MIGLSNPGLITYEVDESPLAVCDARMDVYYSDEFAAFSRGPPKAECFDWPFTPQESLPTIDVNNDIS